jgi:hypothetical protein
MVRFSIKDLMLATLLVAVGLSIEIVLFRFLPHTNAQLLVAYFMLCSGLATIGAGLFTPFRKKKLGGTLGFVLGVAFLVIINYLANY